MKKTLGIIKNFFYQFQKERLNKKEVIKTFAKRYSPPPSWYLFENYSHLSGTHPSPSKTSYVADFMLFRKEIVSLCENNESDLTRRHLEENFIGTQQPFTLSRNEPISRDELINHARKLHLPEETISKLFPKESPEVSQHNPSPIR